MLRLRVSMEEAVTPEISANKYALNIRFVAPGGHARPRVTETDVGFELTFCNL
jgi:cell division protein ZapD